MKKNTNPLSIVFVFVPSNHAGSFNPDRFFHVETHFHEEDSFRFRGKNELYFRDLVLNSQGNHRPEGNGTNHLYGIDLIYKDCYSLELREIQAMARTLEYFEKARTRMNESLGYAQPIGHDGGYVENLRRILEKLNIKEFRFQIKGRQTWEKVIDGKNRTLAFSLLSKGIEGLFGENTGLIHPEVFSEILAA
jgi:hypothetical protein